MSLFTAMRAGVSGMSSQGSRMAAISDNISNSATVGYKRADVDFSTLVTGSGGQGSYSAGGIRANVQHQISRGGSIQGTDSTTDLAIQGRGFFVVGDTAMPGTGESQGFALTRAGSFKPDSDGYLRNSAGQYLQGFKLDAGALGGVKRDDFSSLETVRIGGLSYQGSATKRVDFSGNLPAQAAVGDSFESTVSAYSALGSPIDLTITWTNTAANTWDLTVASPTLVPPTATVAGIAFDATGPTAGQPSAPIAPIVMANGADQIDIDFAGIRQFNGDYVPTVGKDGARAGQVSGVNVDGSGTLWVTYDNGARQAMYRLPVADVTNPDGLKPQDGNTFLLSGESGDMFLRDAGSGAVGEIAGGALEASNVDIAQELVSLIETQRAYSSNAKIVQTADEMMEEVTRLKR